MHIDLDLHTVWYMTCDMTPLKLDVDRPMDSICVSRTHIHRHLCIVHDVRQDSSTLVIHDVWHDSFICLTCDESHDSLIRVTRDVCHDYLHVCYMICRVTRFRYVTHDVSCHSIKHVTWLILMSKTNDSYVWHDLFTRVTPDTVLTVNHMRSLIRMWDTNHSYVWHDLFTCLTQETRSHYSQGGREAGWFMYVYILYIHIYICIDAYLCMCVCTYVYMYICIHTYVYIYIYVYIYTCIHIYEYI